MSLSISLPNTSNIFSYRKNVFTEILSSKNVEKVARQFGALVRSRKLQIDKLFIAIVTVLSNSPNTNNYTLKSIFDMYVSLADKEKGEILSSKCLHNRLVTNEMVDCAKEILLQALNVISSISTKMFNKIVPKALRALLKHLGVNDIVLIDGTEFNVQPSLLDDEDFKGSSKGRPHSDGEPARPSVKLHVAFSVAKQTFEYVDITSGCESERAHVLADKFENCLIIADRGYISVDLENEISESNNYFIIKGRCNTSGTIEDAYGADSHLTHLIGQKLKEISILGAMDFDISTKYYRGCPKDDKTDSSLSSDGDDALSDDQNCSCFETHKCRIVRELHNTYKNEVNVVTLRTNLPREIVNAQQILLLYRIRWSIEIFNKVCKSSNTLHSINSRNKCIIFEFIIFSLLSHLIKTFFGYLTQIEYDIEWISIQKLNKSLGNGKLNKFYLSILKYGKSKIYEIVNDLLIFISQNCIRGKPSRRDKEQLRDLPTLVQTINDYWDGKKIFL